MYHFRNVRKREAKTAVFCREGLCGRKDAREEGREGRRMERKNLELFIIQSEPQSQIGSLSVPGKHKAACLYGSSAWSARPSCDVTLASIPQPSVQATQPDIYNYSNYYVPYGIFSPIEL